MTGDIGEPFVNFDLMDEIRQAESEGVIHLDVSLDNEYEEPHLSELERRMKPLDEVETYVVTKTLVKYHWQTFTKVLKAIKERGKQ